MSTTEVAPLAESLPAHPPASTLPAMIERRRGSKAPKTPRAPREAKAKAKPPATGGRTTRVLLRKLDPWTVLKLSIVYYLALFVVILVAGTILWAGASAVGVIGNIESFMVDIGFEGFRLIPSQVLGGVALGGLVLVVAGTCANVLLTALFNLMSDVVGGLRLTLQEDTDRPAAPTKKDGSATV